MQKLGQKSFECKLKKQGAAGANIIEELIHGTKLHECNVTIIIHEENTKTNIDDCIMSDKLYLANGQYIDIITNAARKDGAHFNMPVCKGRIENNMIYVIRDTVQKDQYSEKYNCTIMVNKTVIKTPITLIYVDRYSVLSGRSIILMSVRFNV